MRIIHNLKGFDYIEFGREDIVRSSIVKDYIIARTENEDNKVRHAPGWPLEKFTVTPLDIGMKADGSLSSFPKYIPVTRSGRILDENV